VFLENLRATFLEALALARGEMLGQWSDVFGAINKTRQVNHDTSQSLEQVAAKGSAIEPLSSILLRGRHDSKLAPPFVSGPHWLDFAGFKRPE
jgi:hypothetical protein